MGGQAASTASVADESNAASAVTAGPPATSLTPEELFAELAEIYGRTWGPSTEALLLRPSGSDESSPYLHALNAIAAREAPADLLPLAAVDEASVACVALNTRGQFRRGDVVRFFLRDVPAVHRITKLDTSPRLYVDSLDAEFGARRAGLRRMLDQIGPAYERTHLERAKRPRDFVVRPVRIACQNVIVGLAAFAQDSSFDGLSVSAWQTCEVPHVATHEGNRALAALTLCDAFQNGGTMEIRFDRTARILHNGSSLNFDGHPEGRVPASLRRFGRTVGVTLGAEDSASISPREARDLFMAITPMPPELRARVDDAVECQGISPERICFLLLSQVWREIEMDYLLAASSRVASILSGGAAWTDRFARQAESEICRGAVSVGMLYRRLDSTDAAGVGSQSVVRVVEDRTKGVEWAIHPEYAAVTLSGLDTTEPIPWTFGLTGVEVLTVFPRSMLTPEAIAEVIAADVPGRKAVLVPSDIPAPVLDTTVTVLRCPDRLADIDKSVEERLLKSRISRG